MARLAPAPRLKGERRRALNALVYHGPGQRAWESVPDPEIRQPTDAVVRIDATTICGTDLHILKGDVPEVQPGTVLGHEAVGTIVEVGSAVTTFATGGRVLLSCITSAAAASARRRTTASAPAGVAGSWAT
jgi:alcohol dehydrogenase